MRFFILIAILIFLSGCLMQQKPSDIKSFDDCVKAGYPVLESFPRQCKTPDGVSFVSLPDLFNASFNSSCSEDSDCILVDEDLDFRCCWQGACQSLNYSESKWIGVNSGWFDGTREKYCPNATECGPAPMCAVRVQDTNFTASCIGNKCMKIPISANTSANTSFLNVTANETVPANITIPENVTIENETAKNQTRNLSGILFGDSAYLLVLEDISIPDYCALMSVDFAANQSQITKIKVCPGEEQNWISPEGRVFRIKVTKTAAGYTKSERWAQVIIYG